MADVVARVIPYSEDQEHILRRLGGAVARPRRPQARTLDAWGFLFFEGPPRRSRTGDGRGRPRSWASGGHGIP